MYLETLENFCKDASRAFFNTFSLISHQINLFSQFIWISECNGLWSGASTDRKEEDSTEGMSLLHTKKSEVKALTW